jgi:FlaA1/EpsC-like NDP-sugar epimerase
MENSQIFKDKRILVIGGTGSCGSVIVKRLLNADPKVIRVFSRDEDKQYHMQFELGDHDNVRFLLGDIRDKDRLARAMEDIDIVFHTAALKHVAGCEYNPFEAVRTNILGTQNVIDVALDNEVSMVAYTSSDKAVNPISAMGASKLMAEKLMSTANLYRGLRRTVFYSVRFGNVLGSRGSVISRVISQIKNGRPVTLTDPRMTRFVMSTGEAVDLMLRTTELAKGGEVFILKMPAIKIEALLNVLIRKYAPKYGLDPEMIKVKKVGIKPGEKLFEELMTNEESSRAYETDKMFIVLPPLGESDQPISAYDENTRRPSISRYASDDARFLSEEEIEEVIDSGIWLDEENL